MSIAPIHDFYCSLFRTRSSQRINTIISAVVAAMAIWAISTFIGGVDLSVNDGALEVGLLDVVVVSAGVGLVGWGLLAFLERQTSRAWTIWRTIAIVLLIVSMLGALGADTTLGRTTLSLLHAAVGVILIKGFSATIRRGQDRP